MANRKPGRESARNAQSSPDVDRDLARGPASGRSEFRDQREYGDYEIDDIRSPGGVPHRRATPEGFGFAAPPNYSLGAWADVQRGGHFFGRGPKGYRRSDERIKEEISDRLMAHPDIDASDVEVQVANGIVTLTGTVEDRHEKRLTEYVAEDALGVDDVNNQLKVRHGFWATLAGERASETELARRPEREMGVASKQGGRANAARSSARRDTEAR